ncbi:hypothetical protein SH501x_003194 [Pirellulaceae bacterium SH501]
MPVNVDLNKVLKRVLVVGDFGKNRKNSFVRFLKNGGDANLSYEAFVKVINPEDPSVGVLDQRNVFFNALKPFDPPENTPSSTLDIASAITKQIVQNVDNIIRAMQVFSVKMQGAINKAKLQDLPQPAGLVDLFFAAALGKLEPDGSQRLDSLLFEIEKATGAAKEAAERKFNSYATDLLLLGDHSPKWARSLLDFCSSEEIAKCSHSYHELHVLVKKGVLDSVNRTMVVEHLRGIARNTFYGMQSNDPSVPAYVGPAYLADENLLMYSIATGKMHQGLEGQAYAIKEKLEELKTQGVVHEFRKRLPDTDERAEFIRQRDRFIDFHKDEFARRNPSRMLSDTIVDKFKLIFANRIWPSITGQPRLEKTTLLYRIQYVLKMGMVEANALKTAADQGERSALRHNSDWEKAIEEGDDGKVSLNSTASDQAVDAFINETSDAFQNGAAAQTLAEDKIDASICVILDSLWDGDTNNSVKARVAPFIPVAANLNKVLSGLKQDSDRGVQAIAKSKDKEKLGKPTEHPKNSHDQDDSEAGDADEHDDLELDDAKAKQMELRGQEGPPRATKDGGDDESGDDESGADESGDDESGDDESGDDESGDDESGDDESGDDESGDDESGDDESGDDESGDDESGDDESGDDESGDDESGDDESGDDESGDDESGDDESGDNEQVDGQIEVSPEDWEEQLRRLREMVTSKDWKPSELRVELAKVLDKMLNREEVRTALGNQTENEYLTYVREFYFCMLLFIHQGEFGLGKDGSGTLAFTRSLLEHNGDLATLFKEESLNGFYKEFDTFYDPNSKETFTEFVESAEKSLPELRRTITSKLSDLFGLQKLFEVASGSDAEVVLFNGSADDFISKYKDAPDCASERCTEATSYIPSLIVLSDSAFVDGARKAAFVQNQDLCQITGNFAPRQFPLMLFSAGPNWETGEAFDTRWGNADSLSPNVYPVGPGLRFRGKESNNGNGSFPVVPGTYMVAAAFLRKFASANNEPFLGQKFVKDLPHQAFKPDEIRRIGNLVLEHETNRTDSVVSHLRKQFFEWNDSKSMLPHIFAWLGILAAHSNANDTVQASLKAQLAEANANGWSFSAITPSAFAPWITDNQSLVISNGIQLAGRPVNNATRVNLWLEKFGM